MRAALWLFLASCGRIGFDAVAHGIDSGADSLAPDAPVASWTGLVAYADQTCAIRAGSGYCWGQIGQESGFAISATPHIYPLTGVTVMAPGEQFTCAAHGMTLSCYGNSPYSIVGVNPVAPIRAASAGRNFACLIADVPMCWGANGVGQLGLGDMNDRSAVSRLSLSTAYDQIRAGDDHACAYGPGVPAVCWGHNDNGAIGTGTMAQAQYLTPQTVTGISGLPLIAGWHTCAVSGGSIWCWGRNTEGELGDGGSTSTATPEAVVGAGTVLAIGGGPTDYDATCIVASHPECWGRGGTYGRLGNGAAGDSASAVDVIGLPTGSTTIEMAIGYDHACALLASDEIWCWGRGDLGQLGDGLMTSSLAPVKVALP